LRKVAFVGIAGPLVVGGTAIAFGTSVLILGGLLLIVGIVSVVQLLISAWSLVASWTDQLEYSVTSATENFDLATKYRELGQRAVDPPSDLQVRFAVLAARDDSRRSADSQKSITNEEKRRGHRAGLLHFQRKCTTCGNIPTDMKSTNCGVCGSFTNE
jgi:mobilome CxxCx(11)CxxC protein